MNCGATGRTRTTFILMDINQKSETCLFRQVDSGKVRVSCFMWKYFKLNQLTECVIYYIIHRDFWDFRLTILCQVSTQVYHRAVHSGVLLWSSSCPEIIFMFASYSSPLQETIQTLRQKTEIYICIYVEERSLRIYIYICIYVDYVRDSPEMPRMPAPP